MNQNEHSILLLAQEPQRRAQFSDLLAGAGFGVRLHGPNGTNVPCSGGPERPASVVLVDLESGDRNTPEVLNDLHHEDSLRDARFIHLLPDDEPAEAFEGGDLSADYSLRAPVQNDHLIAIIHAASAEFARTKKLRQAVRDRSQAIGTIVEGRFEVRTPKEAQNLATMLSLACPDPENAAIGLIELLINGIEHGNLEIGFDDKSELLATGDWEREIERRLELPEFAERRVRVDFARRETSLDIRVADQGKGFDFTKYLDGGPQHPKSLHGRGIFLARAACFSTLRYEGCGNVAIAELSLS